MDLVWLVFAGFAGLMVLALLSHERQRRLDARAEAAHPAPAPAPEEHAADVAHPPSRKAA